jgi:hypothetical protein
MYDLGGNTPCQSAAGSTMGKQGSTQVCSSNFFFLYGHFNHHAPEQSPAFGYESLALMTTVQ